MIEVILTIIFISAIVGCFTKKHKGNSKNSTKFSSNQDLQNLAYMDDLLSSQKKKNKQTKKDNPSGDKCPFCNNPYYECNCSHSGENKEKISQRFMDNEW